MSPTVFVSHGSPALSIEAGPSRDFLAGLGKRLGTPRAIVCVSAHWETEEVTVNLDPHPATTYDFYGFPPELYNIQYPAPGDPELGRRILDLVPGSRGVDQYGVEKRGFDHGVWSPLILMYPDASIPVVAISVQPCRDPAHHYAVGQALAPLRREGILIMGSGAATHNLRELGRSGPRVTEFERWMCDAVTEGRAEDLLHYEQLAPHARRNHPTPEHLLPLYAPLGAAGGKPGEVLNRIFEYESLSMAAFLWL
jgi:4,5-DOPA dioxygenase extradiol